MAQVFPLIKF
jgi:hypothetical protein